MARYSKETIKAIVNAMMDHVYYRHELFRGENCDMEAVKDWAKARDEELAKAGLPDFKEMQRIAGYRKD